MVGNRKLRVSAVWKLVFSLEGNVTKRLYKLKHFVAPHYPLTKGTKTLPALTPERRTS
jgi:hypothetical protein